ncbi:MAG: acyltransferase, partial [Acidobacteria bacterium]|nr:acyltransferase [Acidobacteriota bacterium]
ALLLMLLFYSGFSVAVWGFAGAKSRLVDSLITLFYMSNWARALGIHAPNELGHTWSLSIEEQFYAIWPPLLLVLLRKAPTRLTIALIALALAVSAWMLRWYLGMAGATTTRLFNGLDTRADALMIGCMLGILLSSNLIPRKAEGAMSRILSIASVVSLSVLVGIAFIEHWWDPVMYYWLLFVVELLTAILIFDCFTNPPSIVRIIVSFQPLVWIGVISYGLYLWHYPIFTLMREAGYDWKQIITAGTLLTFVIAILSYFLLERPFLKLKKRLEFRPDHL